MSGADGRPQLEYDISSRREAIERYLKEHPPTGLSPGPLADGVWEYVRRGGKALRGAVCMLSCGLFGGREEDALPAAAAIEVFHAWTLVHDDIVDRDNTRRGGPTLHRHFERLARSGHDREWYGLSLALLAGDIQHAWTTELLCGLSKRTRPEVALAVLRQMGGVAVPQLVHGEVLDIDLAGTPFSEVRRDAILEMVYKKTAVLYRYAGRSGAWIGRGSAETDAPVETLEEFLGNIGVAFQLKDDVLGVTSTAAKTGKDSDSDIREGKRTLIAALAYERAGAGERMLLDQTLGNANAATEEIGAVRVLFQVSGAVQAVEVLARELVDRALVLLKELPDRPERRVLEQLAQYLVQRDR